MTKVLILNGSPRKGGNTDVLIESFSRGAIKSCDVETLRVSDFNVHPCRGCNACKANESGRCVVHDDMMYFWEKLSKTDVLIVASPVYFYGISATLKAIVDRLHAPARAELPIKKLGLLLVAASSDPTVFDPIKLQYEKIVSYFKLQNAGIVCVGGVEKPGDAQGSPLLAEAERMGGLIE